jgi:tripartite-type tricarboxylate transporter receptor subunit TctC
LLPRLPRLWDAGTTADAQDYPSRPITMVVPYPPGGPTDTLARIVSEHMRKSLGQSIIIENVSGAGGSIGVGRVTRAVPDGYTFGIGQISSHVFNGAVYTLQYDLLKDLEPAALLTTAPMWIIARHGLPANLQGLLAWLKANKASFVSKGSADGINGIKGCMGPAQSRDLL